jgi:hypothetical protein
MFAAVTALHRRAIATLVVVCLASLVSLGGAGTTRAHADEPEPLLRGPYPFAKDNHLSLEAGYGVANDFHGVRAAVSYGYELAGSLWLDLHLDVVDGSAAPPVSEAPCAGCAEVATFVDVMGGLRYKLRTEIPLVPYGSAVAGPVFLFSRGARGAVGIAMRGAVGARYFLYEWLGLGLELGALLGGVAVDDDAGLSSTVLMVDFGLGAEVQF